MADHDTLHSQGAVECWDVAELQFGSPGTEIVPGTVRAPLKPDSLARPESAANS